MRLLAKNLKEGMIVRMNCGPDQTVESLGLPFVCDGTVRIKMYGIDYPLVIPENEWVEIVV